MSGKPTTFGVFSWFLFLGLYLLCSGSAAPAEIAAGAGSATLSLWLVGFLRDSFRRALQMKPRWLLLLWRIPPAMLVESWLLLRALCLRLAGRESGGTFFEQPLASPGDRHDLARSAFLTFGVCITPNSYLVLHDLEKRTVLIRQLAGKRLATLDRLFVELP